MNKYDWDLGIGGSFLVSKPPPHFRSQASHMAKKLGVKFRVSLTPSRKMRVTRTA